MSYNRFQWWRTLPRHKKKCNQSHPLDKIRNGDFEYPREVQQDLENAQTDLRRLEQELEERMIKSSATDIEYAKRESFRLKRVRITKLKEELALEDIQRIESFREILHKTFWPGMDKEVKDLILDDIYDRRILAEKNQPLVSRSIDIVKDSIQNTVEIYNEYERRIVEYVDKLRRENRSEETVEGTVEKVVASQP